MPIIRSTSDNAFVLDLVKKQGTVTDLGVWLGLQQIAELKFYWIDNTSLAGKYSAWDKGEPNNPAEKCGHMYGRGSHVRRWNDISCDLESSYQSYAPVVLFQKVRN